MGKKFGPYDVLKAIPSLVEEYREGYYLCFLAAKPPSAAIWVVEGYTTVNKKIKQKFSGALMFVENTLENTADSKVKTKMDRRGKFGHLDPILHSSFPAFQLMHRNLIHVQLGAN